MSEKSRVVDEREHAVRCEAELVDGRVQSVVTVRNDVERDARLARQIRELFRSRVGPRDDGEGHGPPRGVRQQSLQSGRSHTPP